MAGDPGAPPADRSLRWAMLAGVWAIYFSFGLTVAAVAPLIEPIVADLGIGLAAMGAILGAWPLVYIAAALPAGALVDRIGVRACLAAAAACIAISGAARAFAVDPLGMFLAVALFGVGGPLVSIGAPKVISEWFDERERGLAMGIYITGPSLGGIAALALTNAVMMPALGGDWRRVLLVYAGVAVVAGAGWMLLTARVAAPPSARPPGARGAVFRDLVRVPAVRLVLAMSVGIFFINHGLNNWLPEILRTSGMSAAEAGYWAALPTAVGIAGSLLIPRLATPARRQAILVALFVCAAAAALLLASGVGVAMGLGLVLQGVARSSMMTLAILVLMDTPGVGSRHMGAAGGLFFTAAEVGGVLGPLAVGVAAELTGGFTLALHLMALVCLLLIALGLTLRRVTARSRAGPG